MDAYYAIVGVLFRDAQRVPSDTLVCRTKILGQSSDQVPSDAAQGEPSRLDRALDKANRDDSMLRRDESDQIDSTRPEVAKSNLVKFVANLPCSCELETHEKGKPVKVRQHGASLLRISREIKTRGNGWISGIRRSKQVENHGARLLCNSRKCNRYEKEGPMEIGERGTRLVRNSRQI